MTLSRHPEPLCRHPERSEGPALLLALLLAASTAAAQGNLSTQGLGFPPGQLSTAARTMGGAIGEADPSSPLNPAALGLITGAIVMMQAEPEFRSVTIGDRTLRTSIARFPIFQGGLAIGSRWALGVSASTLLDRTWETTTRDTQVVGPDTIPLDRTEKSDGSIADLRLGVSYSLTDWLKVGIGGHALSGRDQLSSIRVFEDTASFVADTQRTLLSFGGNAVSVGALVQIPNQLVVGASYRRGGSISSETATATLGRGSAPDHMGLSVIYLGVPGAVFAARVAKDGWSSLQGMGTNLNIHEGLDVGVGADINGPSLGSNMLSLRTGARFRTLPFSPDATPVKETTFSGGFALPMARNRVELNIGALRARRTGSAVAATSETSWTISTGFSVRP